MRKTQKLLAVSIGISLVTLGILIYFTTREGFIKSIKQIKLKYLITALAFHGIGWVFWGLRTKFLAKASDLDVSLKKSTEIVLSSTFMAAITPSYAGGEPSRIYLLGKENKSSSGLASAIVLGERALDAIFLIFAGSLSILILSKEFGGSLNLKAFSFAVAILMLIVSFVIFLSLFKLDKIKKFISLIERPIEKIRPGTKEVIYDELESFNRVLWNYIQKGKYELGIAFILTISLWALEFSIPYVLLKGLGAQVDFITAWSSYALILLIVMIPLTPGGSGIAELGASAIYSSISQGAPMGIFTLLWRFVTYYTNIGVGGFVSSKILKDLDEIENKID